MPMINVDVRYRPVRIGWCVPQGSPAAVRTALRLTHALWGGAYNPVVCIGQEGGSQQAAERLVREFHVDVLWPIDPDPAVQEFIAKHPHLCWKDLDFSNGDVVLGSAWRTARLLSVGTAYVYWSQVLGGLRQRGTESDQARADQPAEERGPLRLTWADSDPLADYFLATFGDLPGGVRPNEVSRWDVRQLTRFDAITSKYGPIDLQHIPMSLHRLTRVHLEPEEPASVPGLMCGDASSMDDIVTYWNLRASGEDVLFFDPRHLDRMSWMVERAISQIGRLHTPRVVIRWGEHPFPAGVERQLEEQQIRIEDRTASAAHGHVRPFQGHRGILATVDDHRAPSLAVNLPDPLNLPGWEDAEHMQESLVVSLAPTEDLTHQSWIFFPPHLPKLNRSYGELLHVQEPVRAEPRRIGVIVSGARTHLQLRAISPEDLMKCVFRELAQLEFTISDAGRAGQHIVRQMGGLHECGIFRNPGVRDIIRTNQEISDKRKPIGTIASACPRPPATRSKDQKKMAGDENSKYAWQVWNKLLERDVFRVGVGLRCPHCQFEDWYPLSRLDARVTCDFCGTSFNTAILLSDKEGWQFRVSGIFSSEKFKNGNRDKGNIPVLLALLQLGAHLGSDLIAYTAGAKIRAGFECETDLAVLAGSDEGGVELIVGECKTAGEITADDLNKLQRARDRFSDDTIDVYLLLAKTAAWNQDELELLRNLPGSVREKLILFGKEEMEAEPATVLELTAQTLSSLARTTVQSALGAM